MTHITVPTELAAGFQDYVTERYDLNELVEEPDHTPYLDVDEEVAGRIREEAWDAGLRSCIVTDLQAPRGLYQEDGDEAYDRLMADIDGAIAYTLADRGA